MSGNAWAKAPVRHLPGAPAHGLALGGKTFKLKFGHRGGNQPVKNRVTGRVEITSRTTALRWTLTPSPTPRWN